MSYYARETSVSPEKTQSEITSTLMKYKATDYMTGWAAGAALVAFRLKNRFIRITVRMPEKEEKRFKGARKPERAWEQAVRQRWRALLLILKAKLEAVASGVATLEEEFMAYIVVPGGKTVGEEIIPQLDKLPASGGGLLLALAAPDKES